MNTTSNTQKKSKAKRNSLLLVLTAFIWGTAFVAQSTGGDAVGPFTFSFLRSIIGGTVLIPSILFLDRLKLTKTSNKEVKSDKNLIKGGILCGIILFVASNLQQVGIYLGCNVGKAGFLTACYILLVPILGLFLKKTCGINVWIGVVLAVIGLYLLCINGSFSIELRDGLLLLCALTFAVHILVIDHFTVIVDGVRMACIQFFTCGVLSAIPMLLTECKPDQVAALGSLSTWIAILYAGLLSSGVAYTLQIVGQEDLNPAVASLIMSLESVFSVLAGWVILHQVLSFKEIAGCLLIFAAIILAQLPSKKTDHLS